MKGTDPQNHKAQEILTWYLLKKKKIIKIDT